jgi:ribosomal protein L7/L12
MAESEWQIHLDAIARELARRVRPEWVVELLTHMAQQRKIEAIKALREMTQLGLQEANGLIEAATQPSEKDGMHWIDAYITEGAE